MEDGTEQVFCALSFAKAPACGRPGFKFGWGAPGDDLPVLVPEGLQLFLLLLLPANVQFLLELLTQSMHNPLALLPEAHVLQPVAIFVRVRVRVF